MDVHTPTSEIPFLRSRGRVENQENDSCKAKTEEMCMEEVPIFIENIRLPSEFGLRPRGPGLRRRRSHVAEEEREWLPGWKKQNKGFECKVCFEQFESNFLLQQHRAIHDSGDTYACNFCDNVFQSKSSFTAHRRKHKGSMRLKCFKQHCSWSFESEATRKKHMLTHKPPPAFKSCPHCDMLFSNSHSLQDHMGTHVQADVLVAEVQESVSDRPYMCDKCGQSFTCEQSMTDHILKMHQKCVCDVCGDVIHGKSSMNKHMKKHPKAKIYKCHQCKRGFAYQRNLAIHTQKHESQDKLICEHCGKGFFSKHYMKIHIRKHTGEESAFKCNVCPFSTYERSHFLYHKRIHTGEKPFKCSLCPAAFACRDYLKKHKDSHNAPCGLAFTNSASLGQHMENHPANGIITQQALVSTCTENVTAKPQHCLDEEVFTP